jgi:hypothetical protein
LGKQKKNIDDFFKDHLKGSQLPIDGSEWDRLAKDLAKQPSRKGLAIWPFSKLGEGASNGRKAAFWMIPAAMIALVVIFILPRACNQSVSNDSSDTEIALETDTNNNRNIHSNDNELLEPLTDNMSDVVDEENTTPTNSSTDIAVVDEKTNTPTNNGSTKNFEPGNTAGSNNEGGEPTTSGNPVVKTETPTEVLTPEDETTVVPSNTDTRKERALPSLPSRGLSSISTAEDISSILSRRTVTPLVLNHPESLNNLITPNLDNINDTKLWLAVNYSIGVSNQTLQSTVLPAYYKQLRDKNETFGISHEIGVSLKYNLNNSYLKGGLNYTQLNSHLANSQLIYQIHDSVPFISIPGDTTWLRFNFRDTTLSGNMLVHPRYNYVSIPLSIGKEFEVNTRLSAHIGATINPKVLASAKGTIVSPSLGIGSVSRENISTFGLSGGLHFGLNYRLKPNMILEVSAGNQHDILNISEINGVRQLMNNYNLGVGIRYKLK